MTHSLHRKGTRADLSHDFVVHAMPANGFNNHGSQPKLQKFWRLAHKHHPVNSGECKQGNQFVLDPEYIHDRVTSTTHAAFTEESSLVALLEDLKREDVGMSITLSGLEDRLFVCCASADVRPYAIEHSLGVLGDTSKMPDERVMQMTTMCGHAMVSRGLVGILVKKIKCGELSPEQAGVELAKPCQCGIFNPVRAAMLLEEFCALYTVQDV